MGLGNIPSYSPSESLLYGLPSITSLNGVGAGASGATARVGPYKRHGYQVSGSPGSSCAFRVYASNDPNQPREDYQQIAAYAVDGSGLMYSDEWCFDSAYAAITDYGGGTFTVIEKHSP